MNRHQKEQAVGELSYEFGAAEAVYAVDYRGLSVAQITDLRGRLLSSETTLKVVKNSVTKLAAEKAGVATINGELTGPTALAFVRGDAAAAAKTLSGFAKESNDILELKGGLLNGKALASDDVIAIAKLPTREVLYQQLVSMVAQPISGTARTLNALLAAIPVQLGKIAEQGLLGAPAPEAAAPAAPTEEAPAAEAEATTETPAEPSGEATPEADASGETTDSTEE
jgi:large subunit ribosomal protein L10